MKSYTYKLKWLFYVSPDFFTPVSKLKKNLFNVIRILGPRSITHIYFRDEDLKILHKISGNESFRVLKKEINTQLKKDIRIYSVELIRR